MRDRVLTFTDRGIYCPAGDFYIDPWRPVDRALITHGHSDHARAGHARYLCTELTAIILHHRLGKVRTETIAYGAPVTIGGAIVSFLPAGHVPGSAQIRVEVKGEVWVVSGDYKTEFDGLSDQFVPVSCHAFVTESTFGLPVFRWAPQEHVASELNEWWAETAAQGRTPVLGAYSLGKAQRLLSMLDADAGPILTHGAIESTNAVLRSAGIALPQTTQISPENPIAQHPGALVIAPPSALGGTWLKSLGPVSLGFASGWMQLRGIRRRRAVDRGFVLSDHADWHGLNSAIAATGAERIFVTHGYTEIFTHWLNESGYSAEIVPTEFEGEVLESKQNQ